MITATMSAVLLLVSSVGVLPCGHGKVREECTVCAEETSAVHEQISRLESCSGWMARRRAARALRKFDWKCHPEAAEALAGALLNDDCGLVRQEAAESLSRMRPCLAVVHEAVARAAKCDASFLTRCWAKKSAEITGQGLCGYLLDLRARQPCRGRRVAALGPAFDALADGLRSRAAGAGADGRAGQPLGGFAL